MKLPSPTTAPNTLLATRFPTPHTLKSSSRIFERRSRRRVRTADPDSKSHAQRTPDRSFTTEARRISPLSSLPCCILSISPVPFRPWQPQRRRRQALLWPVIHSAWTRPAGCRPHGSEDFQPFVCVIAVYLIIFSFFSLISGMPGVIIFNLRMYFATSYRILSTFPPSIRVTLSNTHEFLRVELPTERVTIVIITIPLKAGAMFGATTFSPYCPQF
jgi:hypothetical protein